MTLTMKWQGLMTRYQRFATRLRYWWQEVSTLENWYNAGVNYPDEEDEVR